MWGIVYKLITDKAIKGVCKQDLCFSNVHLFSALPELIRPGGSWNNKSNEHESIMYKLESYTILSCRDQMINVDSLKDDDCRHPDENKETRTWEYGKKIKGKTRCESKLLQKKGLLSPGQMKIPCSALHYGMPGGVLGPHEIPAYKCKPKQQADVCLAFMGSTCGGL